MFSPSLVICILNEASRLCKTDLADINRIRKHESPRARHSLTMDDLKRLIKNGLVIVVRDTSEGLGGNLKIVGLISILPRKKTGRHRLSVDPEYSKFGIGHQLLREAEKSLEEDVS